MTTTETSCSSIKRPTSNKKLKAHEMFALCEFVRAEYVKMATTDVAFAKAATEKLGFEVSSSSVSTARDVFNIKSTVAATRDTGTDSSVRMNGRTYARIASLEKEVSDLRKELNDLKTNLGY